MYDDTGTRDMKYLQYAHLLTLPAIALVAHAFVVVDPLMSAAVVLAGAAYVAHAHHLTFRK